MKTYKIILLGPGGVGKSKGTNTLMNILHILGFQTSEVKPWTEDMVTTSNFVVHNFTVPPNYFAGIKDPLMISIYDLGGQFKYKDMWVQHAQDTDAIVAVVDMTRETTLKQIPLMLPKGLMQDIPVRLIVNKADLYATFLAKIPDIANHIFAIVQQTLTTGVVDYSVKYKGEDRFIFNSRIYRYGDQISVFRSLQEDAEGNVLVRIGDLEALVASAFQWAMPDTTEHNSYLFGREFTLQVFDAMLRASGGSGTMLDDDLIESAHNEAPPFISWGNDPEVYVPLNGLTLDLIEDAVKSMLITDEDLWNMVNSLKTQGYNIDIGDKKSWALTSAMLYEENPNVNYKPMHKAVIPPFFIKKMVEYNQQKASQEESYFI